MTTATGTSKLGEVFQVIPQLISEIGAITKDQYNQQQKFHYRGIDALYASLHPLLAKHKVFVTTEVLDAQYDKLTSQSGGNLLYARAKVRFRLFACDGSFVESVIPAEAMDSGDKATAKMLSNAYKYFWFHLLCIPTSELPDGDNESPEPAPPPPVRSTDAAMNNPSTFTRPGTSNRPPPCPECKSTETGWGAKPGFVFCRTCKKTTPINHQPARPSAADPKFDEQPKF